MLSTQTLTLGSNPAYFGSGAIEELPAILPPPPEGQDYRYSRAFIVTDRGLVAAGIAARIERILASTGMQTAIFDSVHPNPDTENLEAGARAARRFGQAVIVAVGGGSVMDVAKGIALMAVNKGQARDFDYHNKLDRPGAPVVAVPTTAGTGSETNGFAVIDDPESRRKFYVGHESAMPKAVVLDPELTIGLPARPTAASGIDVLTHALESLASHRANPYAHGLSLQAVRTVARFLPRAVADGADLEARAQMLLAAHMAGLAFSTTGLGVCHAMGHALSACLGTPHGEALAVMLPHALSFNLPVRTDVYAEAAWALGVYDSSRDEQANAQAAIDAIRALAAEVGMPQSLRQLGGSETLVSVLAESAVVDEVLGNNPKQPGVEEIQALLQAAV